MDIRAVRGIRLDCKGNRSDRRHCQSGAKDTSGQADIRRTLPCLMLHIHVHRNKRRNDCGAGAGGRGNSAGNRWRRRSVHHGDHCRRFVLRRQSLVHLGHNDCGDKDAGLFDGRQVQGEHTDSSSGRDNRYGDLYLHGRRYILHPFQHSHRLGEDHPVHTCNRVRTFGTGRCFGADIGSADQCRNRLCFRQFRLERIPWARE